MVKFLVITLLISLLTNPAFCREYKIEELLNIAEKNSSNIKSARYLKHSQKHFANQQKYWDNPVIGVDRIWGQNTLSLSQSVPFYGKLESKYNIQEAEYRILDARENNISLFVKAEVFRILYHYKVLEKRIELSSKRLKRLSLVDKYLSKITANSPTKKAQHYIAKDKIRLVELNLARLQQKLYKTWNEANIYLNLDNEPTDIKLEWLGYENFEGKDFLVNKALNNNFYLREQKLLIQKYKSELSFAKVEKMPSLNLSVMKQNGSASKAGSVGVNKDTFGVGLSMLIPLFDRNKEKVISAKSKIKSQKHALEFQEKRLASLISNDINEYETSLKLSQNFPISNIKKTIAYLSKANSDFKKGVLDFITYIELDSTKYEAIDAVLDTQINLATSYSRLMIKVGSFTVPTSHAAQVSEKSN